ncbi:MAG: hypothetical protein R3F48_08380 [Candidatus Zixiibacteriota bacterium]
MYFNLIDTKSTEEYSPQVFMRVKMWVVLIGLLVLFLGCAYSRWIYSMRQDPHNNEVWRIEYFCSPQNNASTSFKYSIIFCELDTLTNPRFEIVINKVKTHFTNSNNDTNLLILEIVDSVKQVQEQQVAYSVFYSEQFKISKPRPDTLYFEQDITIKLKETGEVVANYHQTNIGTPKRFRRWYIIDLLEAD